MLFCCYFVKNIIQSVGFTPEFFHSLRKCIAVAGSLIPIAFCSSGWRHLMKTLVYISPLIKLGTLWIPCSFTIFTYMASASGIFELVSPSANIAKFKFYIVYSCPQKTLVSGDIQEATSIAFSICSALPSKNLPQPPMKTVSPVNTHRLMFILT